MAPRRGWLGLISVLANFGLGDPPAFANAAQDPKSVNAAKWLDETEIAGTIAVGKQADRILLRGNPLTDVGNAREPAGVMTRGRWLARSELDRLLGEPQR